MSLNTRHCCIWFTIPPWPGGFCSSFQPHLLFLSQQCALQPFLTFSSSNLAHTHSCLWAFAPAATSACDILPTPSFIPNLTWPSGINLDVLHSCVYIFKECFWCLPVPLCYTLWYYALSRKFFLLLFYFFKLWKDDNTFTRNLENTEQWYM